MIENNTHIDIPSIVSLKVSRRALLLAGALKPLDYAQAQEHGGNEYSVSNLATAGAVTSHFFGELAGAALVTGGLTRQSTERLMLSETTRLGILALNDHEALSHDIRELGSNLYLIPIVIGVAESLSVARANSEVLTNGEHKTVRDIVSDLEEEDVSEDEDPLSRTLNRVAKNAAISAVVGGLSTYISAPIATDNQIPLADDLMEFYYQKQRATIGDSPVVSENQEMTMRREAFDRLKKAMTGILGYDRVLINTAANGDGAKLVGDPPWLAFYIQNLLNGEFARDPMMIVEAEAMGTVMSEVNSLMTNMVWLWTSGIVSHRDVNRMGGFIKDYAVNQIKAGNKILKAVTDGELRDVSFNGAEHVTKALSVKIETLQEMRGHLNGDESTEDTEQLRNEIDAQIGQIETALQSIPAVGFQIDLRSMWERKKEIWETILATDSHPLLGGTGIREIINDAAWIFNKATGKPHKRVYRDTHTSLDVLESSEHVHEGNLNEYLEVIRDEKDTERQERLARELRLGMKKQSIEELAGLLTAGIRGRHMEEIVEELANRFDAQAENGTNPADIAKETPVNSQAMFHRLLQVSPKQLRPALSVAAFEAGLHTATHEHHDHGDPQLLSHGGKDAFIGLTAQMMAIPGLVVTGLFALPKIVDLTSGENDTLDERLRSETKAAGKLISGTTAVGDNIVAKATGENILNGIYTNAYGEERYANMTLLRRAVRVAPALRAMLHGPLTKYGNMPTMFTQSYEGELTPEGKLVHGLKSISFKESLENPFAWLTTIGTSDLLYRYIESRLEPIGQGQLPEAEHAEIPQKKLLSRRKLFSLGRT
ncbi:MAG: hypothetical protein UU14_C0016G0007 [Candidatus Roizmanbacteria bacterium GW2011_GWB1_40_7]|uniref:Uncharacterized protein n=1 Tax=Candidatus Roizmanbacteria bacterium GW2011_GWB1_40_7 TaxID=1618482 RepID=A0A0G0W9I2_9BACT|nr:MAG: hypothetical protein UU14_C0016G0007 [Candidatus Roizmanbacteria bacterium GW2011_GWB1_40_7]